MKERIITGAPASPCKKEEKKKRTLVLIGNFRVNLE